MSAFRRSFVTTSKHVKPNNNNNNHPSKQKLTKTGVKLGSPRRASVYPLPARLAAWVLLI